MFYFNLLVWNINFHVHFWLLLSKRALQGLFEKRAHRQKTLGGGADNLPAPSANMFLICSYFVPLPASLFMQSLLLHKKVYLELRL